MVPRLSCLLLVVLVASVHAGQVVVTDGDGLRLGSERVRLWGIDAPELGQACKRAGVRYDCGAAAKDMLEALTGGGQVECEKIDRDRYGRTVARCFADGLELGAEMVRQGWAVDFERYSKGAYARQQEEARTAGRGLWSGEFAMPWDGGTARIHCEMFVPLFDPAGGRRGLRVTEKA